MFKIKFHNKKILIKYAQIFDLVWVECILSRTKFCSILREKKAWIWGQLYQRWKWWHENIFWDKMFNVPFTPHKLVLIIMLNEGRKAFLAL